MNYIIKKGRHRAWPLYWLHWFALLINPKAICRKVRFDFSAKYNLGDYDQYDVNKLFGCAFSWVHRNSARFGWRFDEEIGRFILYGYIYDKGERLIQSICSVVANHFYTCSIVIIDEGYLFLVQDEKGSIVNSKKFQVKHKRKIGWLLGLYFGGNKTAPITMNIQINKV